MDRAGWALLQMGLTATALMGFALWQLRGTARRSARGARAGHEVTEGLDEG